jgi:hypothetical protein
LPILMVGSSPDFAAFVSLVPADPEEFRGLSGWAAFGGMRIPLSPDHETSLPDVLRV